MNQAVYAPANVEKAKSIIKRYRLLSYLIGLLPLVAVAFYLADYPYEVILVSLLASIPIMRFGHNKLYRTMILDELRVRQNAPLFHQLVHQGKGYTKDGILQIVAEYSVGNYENVIAACNKKLGDGTCYRKYKYAYLSYLANCYFDVGDDEKLKDTCDWYLKCLVSEKNREKIARKGIIFDFFRAYLNGDTQACESYLSKNPSNMSAITVNNYRMARILLVKGESESARTLFSRVAATAPNLNLGMIAGKAVKAIEEEQPYNAAFDGLKENPDFTLMPPPKSATFFRVWRIVAGIIGAICILLSLAIELGFIGYERDLFAETEAMLSQKYEGVEVIDVFTLRKGEKIADSMFLAKTKDSVLLGCTFSYFDDDTVYYVIQAEQEISALQEIPYYTFHFYCESSTMYARGFICAYLSYIPNQAYYTVSFDLDGTTYYLVINELEDLGSQYMS